LTFVYAGLDKLLDPNFFDPAAPASIQSQFAAFERFSPLGPLVHLVEPLAVPLGLLIALGEIAVGLGALTGIAYRLAALGGALLAGMFFMTASWTVHPYYLGPDLPYMIGWVALALAGHGELLVPRFVLEQPMDTLRPPSQRAFVTRRQVIQVGGLAVLTLLVGAVAGGIRFLFPRSSGEVGGPEASPSPTPTGAPSGAPSQAPTEAPSGGPTPTPPTANGIVVANVTDVQRTGSARFRVPITAPAPLPAGDPGLVIRLTDGSFVAYDATCTHEGCRVSWDSIDGVILCPCHGAAFDAGNHGSVISGPTRIPLAELPLVVDTQAGTISLALTG
jgi:thiosulfate dehydrogenase [quinone] large subunit